VPRERVGRLLTDLEGKGITLLGVGIALLVRQHNKEEVDMLVREEVVVE
jgi:hypothetical protein